MIFLNILQLLQVILAIYVLMLVFKKGALNSQFHIALVCLVVSILAIPPFGRNFINGATIESKEEYSNLDEAYGHHHDHHDRHDHADHRGDREERREDREERRERRKDRHDDRHHHHRHDHHNRPRPPPVPNPIPTPPAPIPRPPIPRPPIPTPNHKLTPSPYTPTPSPYTPTPSPYTPTPTPSPYTPTPTPSPYTPTSTITITATNATGGTLTADIVNYNTNTIDDNTPINLIIKGFTKISAELNPYAPILKNLLQVTIPNTVTTIGAVAVNGAGYGPFNFCTKLNKVIFEENSQLTFIGTSTFNSCSALKSITIPPTVTYIGVNAFASTGLTSITIPPSVSTLKFYAFYGCPDLETVTFEGNSAVTSWNNGWFLGSTNIKTIYATSATLKKWNITPGSNNKSLILNGPTNGVTFIAI